MWIPFGEFEGLRLGGSGGVSAVWEGDGVGEEAAADCRAVL